MRRKKFVNEYNKMRIFVLLLSYLLVGHSYGQNHGHNQQKKARLSSHDSHNKLAKLADQQYERSNGNRQKIEVNMSISTVEKNTSVNPVLERGKSKSQYSNVHKSFSNIVDKNREQSKQVGNASHNQIDLILSKKFQGISNKARVLSSTPQPTGNRIPSSITFPPLTTPQLPQMPQMPALPAFNFPSLPANNINPISPQTNPTGLVSPFMFPTTNLNNFQNGAPVSAGSFNLPPYQAYPNLFQNYNPYNFYSYNQYLAPSIYPQFQGYSTFPSLTYPTYQGSTLNPTSPSSSTVNTAEIRANIENQVFNVLKSKYTNQLPTNISPTQSSLNVTLTAPNGSSTIANSFGDFMKTFNNSNNQNISTVHQSKSLPANIDMSSIYAAFNKPISWPESFNTPLTYKPPTFDEQMKKTYDPANQKIYSFNDPKIAEMFKQISGKSISQAIKSSSVPLTDIKAQKTRQFQNQLQNFQNQMLHKKRLLVQDPIQQQSPHTPTYMSYSQYMRIYGSALKQFVSLQISSYRQQVYQKNLNFIQIHNANINQQYQMGINLFTAIDKLQFLHRYTIQQKVNYLPHIRTSTRQKFQHSHSLFNTFGMSQQIVGKGDDLPQMLSYSFIPHYRAPDSQAWAILSTIQQPYQSYCNCAFSVQQALFQVTSKFYWKSVYQYSKRIYQYVKDYGIRLNNNKSQNEKCKSCLKTGKGKVAIKSFATIEQGNCKEVLKRLKIQAVSASIAAQDLQFYSSGTFTTNSSKLNHEIVVLGFDSKKGYLIKNSWGPQWGQKGLAYVNESCGVCRHAAYPILSFLDTE